MSLVAVTPSLPTMSTEAIDRARRLETELRPMVQVPIRTTHHFHAGMYARTICIPEGVILTGVLVKRPTLLILSGHATVFIGGETINLTGYHVLPASAHRKQVFLAHTDTHLTMLFPTEASTVEEAEAEFTDETHLLMSRQTDDATVIKGE